MSLEEQIAGRVLRGDAPGVEELTGRAIEEAISAREILNESYISAMEEVGRRYEQGEFYLPEMLAAARAMKAGLEILRPHLVVEKVEPLGRVVLGTVQGDLHDIGKNLVGMMLEGAGFEVFDLGIDVPPQRFVEAVREHAPDFVGMSALLTTTLPAMYETIEALEAAGRRGSVRVMVGGAPLTERHAQKIGADLYAPDAALAAQRAKEWLQKEKHRGHTNLRRGGGC
jgi:5-methyltetrahydrofolate--homocysteine methyltransferase